MQQSQVLRRYLRNNQLKVPLAFVIEIFLYVTNLLKIFYHGAIEFLETLLSSSVFDISSAKTDLMLLVHMLPCTLIPCERLARQKQNRAVIGLN